jgi:hypothetical protein
MLSPAKLKAMYPYMFDKKNIGLSFAHGWIDLIAGVCSEIDTRLGEDKRGFHWIQIKEKFGSLRLHCGYGRNKRSVELDQLKHRIGQLLIETQDKSDTMCITCGRPGKIDKTGGYLLVLCPEHTEQRKIGRLGSIWFGENE